MQMLTKVGGERVDFKAFAAPKNIRIRAASLIFCRRLVALPLPRDSREWPGHGTIGERDAYV